MAHRLFVGFFALLLVLSLGSAAFAKGGKPHVKKERPVKVKKEKKRHHHHHHHHKPR